MASVRKFIPDIDGSSLKSLIISISESPSSFDSSSSFFFHFLKSFVSEIALRSPFFISDGRSIIRTACASFGITFN